MTVYKQSGISFTFSLLIFFIFMALLVVNMKKGLLTLAIATICSLGAFAQVTMIPHVSIGIEYGLTTGSLSDYYGSVVGTSVKLEVPIASPRFNLTGTVGFSEYLVRLDYNGPLPLSAEKFIPVELGARYYLSNVAWLEGDAGVSLNNQDGFTGPSAAFIYSPAVGLSAPTNNHKATIDLGLRFEKRGNNSQVAVRLAYRFGPTYPATANNKGAK